MNLVKFSYVLKERYFQAISICESDWLESIQKGRILVLTQKCQAQRLIGCKYDTCKLNTKQKPKTVPRSYVLPPGEGTKGSG